MRGFINKDIKLLSVDEMDAEMERENISILVMKRTNVK